MLRRDTTLTSPFQELSRNGNGEGVAQAANSNELETNALSDASTHSQWGSFEMLKKDEDLGIRANHVALALISRRSGANIPMPSGKALWHCPNACQDGTGEINVEIICFIVSPGVAMNFVSFLYDYLFLLRPARWLVAG